MKTATLFLVLAIMNISCYYPGPSIQRQYTHPERNDNPTLKEKAFAGDKEAQYRLALIYLNEKGEKYSENSGLKWLKKSADQSHIEAQYLLALKLYGKHLEDSDKEAFTRMKICSDSNYVKAHFWIGHFYKLGIGTLKDEIKARKHFKQAADGGIAEGQYEYASMLFEGKGGGVDKKSAKLYGKMSADQFYKDAYLLVAKIQIGMDTSSESYTSAARWTKLAYEKEVYGAKEFWEKHKLWNFDGENK